MEVLLATVRRGAGEVLVVHAQQVADRRRRARSPRATSRATAAAGGSPCSTPPPGQASRRPGRGPRAELRVSSTSSSRGTRAYAASRCLRGRSVVGQRPRTIGTVGTAPESTSATGCHRASTVEPSTSTTRGSGASGATQPSYTMRTECMSVSEMVGVPRCASRSSSGRPTVTSSPVSSWTSRTTASPGCSPKSMPPRGASTARSREVTAPAGRAGSAVAHDHGVRRDALALRAGRGRADMDRSLGSLVGTGSLCAVQDVAAPPARARRPPRAKIRDPWFDNAKMTLVVLVVVGHSWTLLPADDGLRRAGSTTSSTPGTSRRS